MTGDPTGGTQPGRLQPSALALLVLALSALAPGQAAAGAPAAVGESACPKPAEILERLKQLDLRRTSRTSRFESPPPTALFAQAVAKPGRAIVESAGIIGHATMLVELPAEPLWMALNDEEHFVDTDYLPLQQSEVIEGVSRGGERWVYQSFKQFGVGRWWVNRVWQNAELYAASEGVLWELVWEDVMAEVDPAAPPLAKLIDGLKPITDSRGAWLVVSLGESCSLMEYFTDSNPGGMVSSAQKLFGGRTLRSTIEGMVVMAREEIPRAHDGAPFLRPDGSVIERQVDGRQEARTPGTGG